jgi:hypothetical protein
MRGAELGAAYEDAFLEWERAGEAALWDVTAGDGTKASHGKPTCQRTCPKVALGPRCVTASGY